MAFTLPHHQKQRFVGSVKGPDQHARTHVKYAKTRSGKTAMMFCGIHPRPAKIPALPDRNSKTQDSSYPILLKSIENSDPNTPFRLSFLGLPTELRDIVLEKIFKLDRPLEFCPMPLRNARRPAETEAENLIDQIPQIHRNYILGQLSPYIGVMRTCKQLRTEVAKVLYGANEFRFTSNAGWIGLERFLLKINTFMAANLRKITVAHPDLFDPPRTHRQEQEFWNIILLIELWQEQLVPTGEPVSLPGARETGYTTESPLHSPSLRSSRGGLSLSIDTTRFKNLSITFTSLGVPLEERMKKPFWLYEDERIAESGRTSWAQEIVESSENTAWCWEYIEADDKGFYAAIDGTRSYQHIPVQQAEDDKFKQMTQR
ncbi:hypothetical protein LTR95_001069 [Oleoguttula sp. CCFEE 5521]